MKAIAFALAAALLVAAAPARAGSTQADDLLERGLRSYAVGRYEEAIASFRRGYELSPRPEFLYALAQAQRMNGDCRGAVASYRSFLRTAPAERAALPARQNLQRCEELLASQPPPDKQPPQTITIIAPPPLDDHPAAPPRPWYRDKAGDALGGVALAAVAAGGVLWGIGEAGLRGINEATRYDMFASRAGSADTYKNERLAGIVCVSLGGALAVGAVARWAWVARHK